MGLNRIAHSEAYMNKAKLQSLIQTAISNGAEPYSLPPYINPKSYFASRAHSYLVKADPILIDPLVQALKSEEDLKLFDGGVRIVGGGGFRVTLHSLANWLIAQSFLSSPAQVIENLEWYIRLDYSLGYEVLALCGITS